MSIGMVWPVAIVVVSNIIYQITAKLVPQKMDAFASLTITYLIATIVSAVLFFVTAKDTTLLKEYSHINWATVALGIAIVGLETGFIYAYKAGWQISTLSVVQNVFLAIALIIIGFIMFKEAITPTKLLGVAIVLIGLYFINK